METEEPHNLAAQEVSGEGDNSMPGIYRIVEHEALHELQIRQKKEELKETQEPSPAELVRPHEDKRGKIREKIQQPQRRRGTFLEHKNPKLAQYYKEDESEQVEELTRAEIARKRQSEGGRRGGKIGSANRWAKAGAREAQSEVAKRTFTPEVRHTLTSQDRMKRWDTPKARVEQSKHMQRYWASRRAEKEHQPPNEEDGKTNDSE